MADEQKQTKLLIVDDEADILTMLSDFFVSRGYLALVFALLGSWLVWRIFAAHQVL